MDLIDRLKALASRIPAQKEHLKTEEATKHALVMPFIQALGYDVFNPAEVVPEFTADVGTKKGEKVDYAILRDEKPAILIECKTLGADLSECHCSQLYRYFSVTSARFAVLTNGVDYRFFSDLEEPNKMDARPFLEFSMLDVDEDLVRELKKITKENFDLENILSTASELKYTNGIKRVLAEEWLNPSDRFIRMMARRVYSGRITQQVHEQFSQIVKRAFHEFVNDRLSDRLKSALAGEGSGTQGAEAQDEAAPDSPQPDDRGIVTTQEELDGFYIVKAIAREVVDVARVFMRDTKSYCGILLDDNNRRPIVRLHFNGSQKYVGTFDAEKSETRHHIDSVDGIYGLADQIKATIRHWDGAGNATATAPSGE